MVKPAGQKRWMAPGALQGPGWASRVRCAPLGDPPKALPPALPVRTSPSSRSVEAEPRAVDGLLAGGGRGGREGGGESHKQGSAHSGCFEGFTLDGAGPWDGDSSGVVVVPSRTPRSSTVPCIEAVPAWGASVGTGPRPSGPAVPWACQRRQTRMHACSRTLRVGPVSSLMSVSMWE